MAITDQGSIGSGSSKTSGTTLAFTVTASPPVDRVVLLIVAADNVDTTDINTGNLVTTVTDTSGNTWKKIREWTNGNAAAGAGATIAIFQSKLTTALTNGVDVVTVNFGSSITAKAVISLSVSVAAGKTLSAYQVNYTVGDGTGVGSLSASPNLNGASVLNLDAFAHEGPSSDTFTPTSGWSAIAVAGTTGGVADTNMSAWADYSIGTATFTRAPTVTVADWAGLWLLFRESIAQHFYFHDAATSLGGTLPGASTLNPTPPTFTATGATTNRTMDGGPGSSNIEVTGPAGIGDFEPWWPRRFLSKSLNAQTIPAGDWIIGAGLRETGASSPADAGMQPGLWVWRPATGLKVGTIFDSTNSTSPAGESLTMRGVVGSIAGASVTVQQGDILVCESWPFLDGAGVGDSGWFSYDGTQDPLDTEGSVLNGSFASAASFLEPPALIQIGLIRTASDALAQLAENLPPQVLAAKNAFQRS